MSGTRHNTLNFFGALYIDEATETSKVSQTMPRFFFHISHGETNRVPNEGLELVDAHAAWVEATAACGEIIKDLDGDLKPGDTWTMTVKDASDADVYFLEFKTRSFMA